MVRLDGDRRTAGEGDALDHIGVERALGEIFRAFDLTRIALEHVDEELADDLALGLRVGNPFELAQKQILLLGVNELHVVVVAEHGDHFLALVEAKKAVVDENAGQLVADRLVKEDGGNRGIHAARQAADDFLVTHLFADLRDRLLAVGAHGPIALAPGDIDEVLIELLAVGRVMHFRVELHRVEMARDVGGDGERRVGRGTVDLEARGDFADMIAVAHPHLLAVGLEPAVQQIEPVVLRRDEGTAEFRGHMPALHLAAEQMHHRLLAVADAENRNAEFEHLLGRQRRTLRKYRGRSARQDHGLGARLIEIFLSDVIEGMDFAVDVQLTQTAGDQLGDLASEVDDEHEFGVGEFERISHGQRLRQCEEGFNSRIAAYHTKGKPGGNKRQRRTF